MKRMSYFYGINVSVPHLLLALTKASLPLILSAIAAILIFSANAYSSANSSPIEQSFNKEMPYADMRKTLIAADWLPLRDPKCWENVGGTAEVCGQLPEVESCSGDGYCVMNFANKNQQIQIRIGTYGPYEGWSSPTEKASLAVNFWEISPVNAPIVGICPASDFNVFIKNFASDKRHQQSFTDALVKMTEFEQNDNDEYTPQYVYTLASGYNGFNVLYQNNDFHFVDYQGKVDPDSLDLEIIAVSQHARLVRYSYGMSEGHSYLFEEKNGCWYLTEDPEAPSP